MRRFAVRRPFAVTVTVVMAAVSAVMGLLRLPAETTSLLFSTSLDSVAGGGHWWSVLTSLFVEPNPAALFLTLPVALLAVGAAEVRIGTRRTAVAFLVTGVVGILLTLLSEAIASGVGAAWSANVRNVLTSNTIAPAMGALVVSSAWMGALWRRRVRLFAVMIAIIAVAYSGGTGDFVQLWATLAGLLLGSVLGPSRRHFGWSRSSHHETRRMLGAAQLVMALGPALTIMSSRRLGALSPLGLLLAGQLPHEGSANSCVVGEVTDNCVTELVLARISSPGPVILSLLPMAVMAVLALGLWRGRRFAAVGAIAMNIGTAAIAAYYFGFLPISGQPYVPPGHFFQHWTVIVGLVLSVALPLAMGIVLAVNLPHFPMRTSRRRVRQFAVASVSTFVAVSLLYVGVGWWARDQFTPALTDITQLLGDLPDHFVPVGFLRLEQTEFLPHSPLTWLLFNWIGAIFWLVTMVGALVCISDSGASHDAPVARRVDELLLRGGSSISHMATWPGLQYWFTPDGAAATAYRVSHGVALTVGTPFGATGSIHQAALDFATFCDDHGWTPAFYSVGTPLTKRLRAAGWQAIPVGEETVINPHVWRPSGKKAQAVRTAVNRAAREQVTTLWSSYRDLPPTMQGRIAALSEAWVTERDLPEMGFTLGGLDQLTDPRVGLLLAVAPSGELDAVTSWLPCYRDGVLVGWTLDFMRHSPTAMNGVMEFVIADMVERQRAAETIEFVSLSVAPLSGVGDSAAAGVLERFLSFVRQAMEPAYGFDSLAAFKRKFLPEFRPVFLVYLDPARLPAIGLAIVDAYVPELSVRQKAQLIRGLGERRGAAGAERG